MSNRQKIDLAREIRLTIVQVVVPTVLAVAAIVRQNPDLPGKMIEKLKRRGN